MTKKKPLRDYPLFLCEPSADGRQWVFWCPFCHVWHAHGAGPGHRCAHCFRGDSPLQNTGYLLRLRKPGHRQKGVCK